MKNLILPIFIIACLIGSCGQKQANTETQQEVYYSSGKYYPQTDSVINLTESDLPKIEWFTLKKIDIPKGYEDLSAYYLYQDSILIMVNAFNPKPKPYMLTVMNYKTKEIIAEYFRYGKANGKLKNLVVKLHENYLYAADTEKKIVTRLSIDSILAKGSAYTTKFTPYNSLKLMDYVYTTDSTITWANTQYINGFGVETVPSFVQTNLDGTYLYNYAKNDSINIHFPMERTITLFNSQYIEFWLNFPAINIYDSNFNIVKQYRDTKFNDTELELDYDHVFEKEIALECFSFGGQTEKSLLVNNYRASVVLENGEGHLVYHGDPANGEFHEIWVFDTSCNLVRRLKCRNLKGQVGVLSYCDQSGNLYMNVFEEYKNKVLYQCIFEK